MVRIGLALSGGGFRATLYHLGLVRFLRDAGALKRVTHITSVSGGSILAAHLALHWDRYTGSANDFDAAASEILSLVRLDVRNRIVRRFPLAAPLRLLNAVFRVASGRQLTRAGLLEYHYERYLYGDISLSELPSHPQLHILATNISEGSLCSFGRNGLLVQRRQTGGRFRFDHVHIGLATVPMAVAASSAFPGFFPPLRLSAEDVGAPAGTFPGHAFTDGAVFDNLGVRMFRYLERFWLEQTPLTPHDFHDFAAIAEALRAASQSEEETPLRRLARLLVTPSGRPDRQPLVRGGGGALTELRRPADAGGGGERLLADLSDLMAHHQFHREPVFADLPLDDARAEALLHAARSDHRELDDAEQTWLNRHLLEAALRQATGRPGFRRVDRGLDGVLVSDVGKSFKVRQDGRSGGLIRTAVRASDILMDRVGQLEKEIFGETPGFIFVPITRVVAPEEDPTAPHPEVQLQTSNIRTDLDRFSPLEVSCLVRHGYCVGRQACLSRPDLFGEDLPAGPPWDPVAGPPAPPAARPSAPARGPDPAAAEARALQHSAERRIWSRLFDARDWVSYVYVPLLVPILVLLPYFVIKSYQRSQRIDQLVESLAQGAPEFREMTRLLEDGPDQPWTGVEAEEVPRLDEPDFKGYEILQDSRVIDLRSWKRVGRGELTSWITSTRRLRVHKLPDHAGANPFRVNLLTTSPRVEMQFPPQQLDGRLRVSHDRPANGPKRSNWEVAFDFSKVPPGDEVDVMYKYQVVGYFQDEGEELRSLRFPIQAETAELSLWMLMPKGREHGEFSVVRFPTGKPEKIERVKVVTRYSAVDSTILSFKLLGLKPGYTYELHWAYQQ